jgi:DNA integrity scanning protein DisA with diadenylate cyclase activity
MGGMIMDIPMEPKRLGLLVAILFFLISLLINLIQRRYGKTRLGRMLRKEESVVNFLEGIHKNLGKIEMTCTLEVQGASSPQEIGKTIHVVRNEIQSTIANMQEHLSTFRQHRRKEKVKEKQKKKLERSSKRLSG